MSVKRMVLSAITCVLIVSQLVGCAAMSSTDMMDLLNSGSDVEISMAVPSYDGAVAPADKQEYVWKQLDQLDTYNSEFRTGFDKVFNVNIITENGVNGKSGAMFVNEAGERDGNTSFSDSLRNKQFMSKYMSDSKVTAKISELASKVYIDVDEGSSHSVYAGLNAYFNLFNEVKDTDVFFNANQSLTREDFYSLVYRVNNGVSDISEDEDFNSQVGTTGGSNLFASQVDEFAWLNADNNGLRPGNYKSSITRAEAIYMLMNYYFKDDVQNIDIKDIDLADAKNGGDMLEVGKEKLQVKDKETKEIITADGWQLGVLAKMQQGNKGYVHTDIYKTLGVANKIGILESETDWNGPLTKSDAIDMVVKIHQVLNQNDGYLTEIEYGTMVGNSTGKVEELPGVEDIKGTEGTESDYIEKGDGSGMYGEPAAKLEKKYEDAMANSDLAPFEKELIRLIVEKEKKTFEEALGTIRPGYKVTETTDKAPAPAPAPAPAKPVTKPTAPTTPPKTNEGASGGADFNNGGNSKTEQEKQMEEDFFNEFNGGIVGGNSQDISHEPEF